MHRELKAEATRPPGFDLRTQQRKLNEFVKHYNNERPHTPLGLEITTAVHVVLRREYREKEKQWDYPRSCQVRRVTKNGALRWRSTKWVMVSTALTDEHVGLEEIGEGLWRVYFRQKMLGYFDEKTLRIQEEQGRLKRNYV